MIIELLLASISGVTVTLPVQAKVRGTEIELREIATVTGADAAEVALVEAVELGYAPAPGYSRVLVAERIRERLRQRLPGVEFEVVGERACRIWPEVVEVPGAELRDAARRELEKAFAGPATTITAQGEIPTVQVPAGTAAPNYVARVRKGERASGAVSVPVEVHVEGVRYRTVWTTWKVEVFEDRSVLARPVRAGQELSPGMFVNKRVRVPAGRKVMPLDRSMVIGAIAKRDLSQGELVTQLDVHRPTIVTLGEPLTLRVTKGPITAQITVQALESGSVGDRIRVRAAETGRELVATVRNRDLCELELH